MATLRRLVLAAGKKKVGRCAKTSVWYTAHGDGLSLYMLIFAIGLVDYFMNEAKALMPVWLGLRARAEARNVRALAALPMP